MDGDVLKPMTNDPIYIPAENLILKKKGYILKFFQLDAHDKLRLSVGSLNGNNHLRILVESDKFIVNNRVRVMPDGSYTVRNVQEDVPKAKLHLICANVEKIKVRAIKFNAFDFIASNYDVVVDTSGLEHGTFV